MTGHVLQEPPTRTRSLRPISGLPTHPDAPTPFALTIVLVQLHYIRLSVAIADPLHAPIIQDLILLTGTLRSILRIAALFNLHQQGKLLQRVRHRRRRVGRSLLFLVYVQKPLDNCGVEGTKPRFVACFRSAIRFLCVVRPSLAGERPCRRYPGRTTRARDLGALCPRR